MMKKIAALIGAGAMLLSVATPAFGVWNYARVNNSSGAEAVTGSNSQNSSAGVAYTRGSSANVGSTGTRSIVTGDACADSTAVTVANTNVFSGDPTTNTAFVNNESFAGASSGQNTQNDSASVTYSVWSTANAGSTGNSHVTTGYAGADSDAWTVVNTNVMVWQ